MNRRPQPADPWFKEHQRVCGGQFIKQSEPEQKKPLKSIKHSKNNQKLNTSQDKKAKTIE